VTEDAALDILAIQDLCARYCLVSDDDDMEAYGALFTPDGEMHAFRQVWKGREEIVAHISRADSGLHMAGMATISVNGDCASGRQNFVFVEKEGQGLRLGHYLDEYVRTDDGWCFAVRKIVFMKSTPPG